MASWYVSKLQIKTNKTDDHFFPNNYQSKNALYLKIPWKRTKFPKKLISSISLFTKFCSQFRLNLRDPSKAIQDKHLNTTVLARIYMGIKGKFMIASTLSMFFPCCTMPKYYRIKHFLALYFFLPQNWNCKANPSGLNGLLDANEKTH